MNSIKCMETISYRFNKTRIEQFLYNCKHIGSYCLNSNKVKQLGNSNYSGILDSWFLNVYNVIDNELYQ